MKDVDAGGGLMVKHGLVYLHASNVIGLVIPLDGRDDGRDGVWIIQSGSVALIPAKLCAVWCEVRVLLPCVPEKAMD